MTSQRPRFAAKCSREALVTGLLLLVPTVSLLVLIASAWTVRAVSVDTGDELTDRFITELIETTEFSNQIDQHMLQDGFFSIKIHSLTEDRLAAWEPEFADDPKYWDLIYNFADYEDLDNSTFLRPAGEEREWYLEEAYRRGSASGPMLLNLIRDKESTWRDEAYDSLNIQSQPKGQTFTPYLKQLWQVIDEEHGTEYDELLGMLEATEPDEAQALYHLGLVEAGRGNYETALQYIERGNNAQSNSNLLGFPFDSRAAIYSEGATGDMIIDGAIAEQFVLHALPSYIRMKRQNQALIEEAVARQDLAGLDVLHKFGCRLGSFTDGEYLQALVGIVLTQKVKDGYMLLSGGTTTPEDRQELTRLDQLYNKIKQECKDINRGSSYPGEPDGALDKTCYSVESILSLGQNMKWRVLQDSSRVASDRHDAMLLELIPRLEQLSRFNYSTLTWDAEPTVAAAD